MKILVVDDDRVSLNMLREFLEKNHFEVYLAENAEQAMIEVKTNRIPLVLSDIKMEESDGLSLLGDLKIKYPKIVMIMMTGFGSMEGAIEAIQKGAFDYISKPFDLIKLLSLINKAVKHVQSLGQMDSPQTDQLLTAPKVLIGSSPKMVEVYKTIARATLSSSTVLIRGESGTGKELVARAIHEHSERKSSPFISVSCGSLSELQMDQAFFRQADGGTLFLDEIADISTGMQVKMLRALQEGEFNVRIIAATQDNLGELVELGKFREDLFYRLKVIEIEIPPLRERKEDIAELANVFLKKYSSRLKKKVNELSKEALHALFNYSWPGNVRELEHQIERAVAMTSSSVLTADDFHFAPAVSSESRFNQLSGDRRSLEEMERTHILSVLKQADYNKSKASEVLGIDRATLYRKAQKYGITLKNE